MSATDKGVAPQKPSRSLRCWHLLDEFERLIQVYSRERTPEANTKCTAMKTHIHAVMMGRETPKTVDHGTLADP